MHVIVSFPLHASNSIDGVGGGVHSHLFPVTLNARKYPSALNELGVRGPHNVCGQFGLQIDLSIISIQLLSVYAILNFMFEFPYIISLRYIKSQQDATLAVLFISHCKITHHVSEAFCVHHQEYKNCSSSHWCMS